MDGLKFLTGLNILWDECKKAPDSEYTSGYKKALYDILEVTKLCKDEPCKTTSK